MSKYTMLVDSEEGPVAELFDDDQEGEFDEVIQAMEYPRWEQVTPVDVQLKGNAQFHSFLQYFNKDQE